MKKSFLILFIVLTFIGCNKKNQQKNEFHNKDENHEDTVLINEELTNIIDETVEFPEDIINTPIVNTKDFFERCILFEEDNIQIQFLSSSLANEGTVKVIKDNKILQTITNTLRPSYSSVTKCIYYLLKNDHNLHAYNVITCTEETKAYVKDEIYSLNKNKDKLFLFCEREDDYGGIEYYLDEYDLISDKYKSYSFSTWKDFNDQDFSLKVNDICVLNNELIVFSLSETFNEDIVILAFYKIENESLKKVSDYTLENAYAWKHNFSHLYPLENDKTLVNILINEQIKTYILDTRLNSIKLTELSEETMLSPIMDKNNEYIGTVKYENSNYENYTIKIYETKNFTPIVDKDFHAKKLMNSIYNFGYAGITQEIKIQEYLEK